MIFGVHLNMKSKLSRNLLEDALARCYDACEKKAGESMIKLSFTLDSLSLSTKGAFTFYEEKIAVISCDQPVEFYLRTFTILEFVKHIDSEDLLMSFDAEKSTCMLASGDKKSKIALQPVDVEINIGQIDQYDVRFDVENYHELVSKLNFATKFCSLNFQDHPLTAIHCHCGYDSFQIKSTNGPMFYSTEIDVKSTGMAEFYLPKKAPSIIKNIFDKILAKKCSINNRTVLLESDDCQLTVFMENDSSKSFPDQILDWTKKDSIASLKISTFELAKTLKYFSGIFSEASVNFNITESLNLEAKENSLAAKETVPTESISGEASSAYNSKFFLDCLDSVQSSWINLDFISMKDSFCLCKMSGQKTLILLCPTTF